MVRRLYTPELANRSLPLVARIAADLQAVALDLHACAARLQAAGGEDAALARRAEELTRRYEDLLAELDGLGIEVKDPASGLLDFRARRKGVEVYLCWRLGEARVDHWHSLDGGFAGRRPIAEF